MKEAFFSIVPALTITGLICYFYNGEIPVQLSVAAIAGYLTQIFFIFYNSWKSHQIIKKNRKELKESGLF